jgi:HEAT repeat protein
MWPRTTSRKRPDNTASILSTSCSYLGIVGAPPDQAVPALTAALADESPEVRREAATALGAFGAAATPALPALRKAGGDPNEDVAREATRAMLRVQEK